MNKIKSLLALLAALVCGGAWADVDETGITPKYWNKFDSWSNSSPYHPASGSSSLTPSDERGSSSNLTAAGRKGGALTTVSGSVHPNGTNLNLGDGDWTIVSSLKIPTANHTKYAPLVIIGDTWEDNRGLGLFSTKSDSAQQVHLIGWGNNFTTSAGTVLKSVTASDASTVFHSYAIAYNKTNSSLTLYVDGVAEDAVTINASETYQDINRFQWGGVPGGVNRSGKLPTASYERISNVVLDDFRVYVGSDVPNADKLGKIASTAYTSENNGAVTKVTVCSGIFDLGTSRPTLTAIDGSYKITVTTAETIAGQIEFVVEGMSGDYPTEQKFSVVTDGGETFPLAATPFSIANNTLTINLRVDTPITESGNFSEVLGNRSGVVTIEGGNSEEAPLEINFDTVPESVTGLVLSGALKATGSVPFELFSYTEGAKILLAPGMSITTATAIAQNGVIILDANGATTANPMEVRGVISGVGAVAIKNGAVKFTGSNTYTGGLTVRSGGIAMTSNVNGFGADAQGHMVTVENGGAVDISNTADAYHASYTIAGTGVSGSGALYSSTQTMGTATRQTNRIVLTADATINCDRQWGLVANGYGSSVLKLNGHTLTKTGSNEFILCNAGMDGAASGSIVVSAGTLHVSGNNVGIGNYDLTLAQGTTLSLDKNLTVRNITGQGSGANIKNNSQLSATQYSGAFIVTSGSPILTGDDRCAKSTTFTVNAGATMKIGRNDFLSYNENESCTVNVYGTLDFQSNRATLRETTKFNFYSGCTVQGYGDNNEYWPCAMQVWNGDHTENWKFFKSNSDQTGVVTFNTTLGLQNNLTWDIPVGVTVVCNGATSGETTRNFINQVGSEKKVTKTGAGALKITTGYTTPTTLSDGSVILPSDSTAVVTLSDSTKYRMIEDTTSLSGYTIRSVGHKSEKVYYTGGYFNASLSDGQPTFEDDTKDDTTHYMTGDTVVIRDATETSSGFSGSEIYCSNTSFAKIKIEKDLTIHAGGDFAILGNAEVEVSEGVTVTIVAGSSHTGYTFGPGFTLKGEGTVIFEGVIPTAKVVGDDWTGTVKVKNYAKTTTYGNFANLCNNASDLELDGVDCYIFTNGTDGTHPDVVCKHLTIGENGVVAEGRFSTGVTKYTFEKLLGSGTINVKVDNGGSDDNHGYLCLIGDASEFGGTITWSDSTGRGHEVICVADATALPTFNRSNFNARTLVVKNTASFAAVTVGSVKLADGDASVTIGGAPTVVSGVDGKQVKVTDNGDGTKTYTLFTPVAKIGEGEDARYYETIDAAITAASVGDAIEILSDISSGGNISTSKDLTICVPAGASRTISRNFRTGCNFTKTGAGNLTANITINSGKALNVNEGTLNLTTDSQGVKGTLNVAAGAVFNNSTTDMFTYSNAGAVANIRGTVNLDTSRWTVQGNIVTLNVYAGATITGTHQTSSANALSMDLFKNSTVNFLKNGDEGGVVNWQVATRLRENSAQTFEFNIEEDVTVKVSKIITDCDNSAAANFTSKNHILKKTGAGTLEFIEGSQLDATFVEANGGTVKYTAGTFGSIHSKTKISGETALVVSTSELAADKIVSDASGKVLGISKAGSVFTYSLWDATNPPAPIVVPEGTTEIQLVPGQTATYEGDTAPETVKIVVPNVAGSGSFDITDYFNITKDNRNIGATLKDSAKPAETAIAMAAPTEEGADKVQFTITNPIPGLFYAVSSCDEPNGDFTSATGDQATSTADKTVSIPMEFTDGKKVKYYKVSVKATK